MLVSIGANTLSPSMRATCAVTEVADTGPWWSSGRGVWSGG